VIGDREFEDSQTQPPPLRCQHPDPGGKERMEKEQKTDDPLIIAVQAQNRSEAQLEQWLSQGDQRALEVVKAQREVSQDNFDEAVRENIEEFEMEIEEAITDAKTQFELQGLSCTEVSVDPERFR
jgi:excinuclease UvrABC nuclease subunit